MQSKSSAKVNYRINKSSHDTAKQWSIFTMNHQGSIQDMQEKYRVIFP